MAPEHMVTGLRFYRYGEEDSFDYMKFGSPTGEFSRRLEAIERGIMRHIAKDVFFVEVYADDE